MFLLDARKFHHHVMRVKNGKGSSVFSDRTEDSSAMQYFQVRIYYFLNISNAIERVSLFRIVLENYLLGWFSVSFQYI